MRPVAVLSEVDGFSVDTGQLTAAIHLFDQRSRWPMPEGELVIRFVTLETSAELHEAFFNDPTPTDVMTFPGDPHEGHCGDIAISPEIARQQADEYGTPFSEECTLYLIHACLHLAGLDDTSQEQIQQMRKAEADMLQALKQQGLLDAFGLS